MQLSMVTGHKGSEKALLVQDGRGNDVFALKKNGPLIPNLMNLKFLKIVGNTTMFGKAGKCWPLPMETTILKISCNYWAINRN